jgi:hypothetical protein
MRAITDVTRGVKATAAVLLLIGGLAMSTSVAADPIPIGTTPAQDLIFNFNFPAVLAGAPYSQVSIDIDLSGFSVGDAFFMDIFKDLNGGGGIDFSFGPLTCTICGSGFVHINVLYDYPAGLPDILDGIFSIGFRLGSGAMDLTAIVATATNAAGGSITLPGAPISVPEPDTMSLLLLALAAMAHKRMYRRRANA